MGFFRFVIFALGLLLCFGLAISEEATNSALKASDPQQTAGKAKEGDPFKTHKEEFEKTKLEIEKTKLEIEKAQRESKINFERNSDDFDNIKNIFIGVFVAIAVVAGCGILICFCVGAACFNRQNGRRPQGGMAFGQPPSVINTNAGFQQPGMMSSPSPSTAGNVGMYSQQGQPPPYQQYQTPQNQSGYAGQQPV